MPLQKGCPVRFHGFKIASGHEPCQQAAHVVSIARNALESGDEDFQKCISRIQGGASPRARMGASGGSHHLHAAWLE